MSPIADDILITERNGSFGKEYFYVNPPNQKKIVRVSLDSSLADRIAYTLKNFSKNIFLPQGYPSSVSDDYTSYQIWDTLQAFCSTVTGILSTQSVMKGVGVGDSDATPLAATITWVLKDGTGHIGRIGFAWWKGTYLDADSKQWRLFADILNDIAICIELSLPFFIDYTTYILCLTTAMKSVVGIAGGATRAALTQHHALRGNLADVAAKDGSQETAVNLTASLFTIGLLFVIQESIWPIFFLFTALHLLSNYFAVTSVCLKTFNRKRLLYFLKSYLENEEIHSPLVINKKEQVIFGKNISDQELCGYQILAGQSLKTIINNNSVSMKDIESALKIHKNEQYLLLANISEKYIIIVYKETASSENVLQSYYHAVTLGLFLNSTNNDRINDENQMHNSLNNIKIQITSTWGNLCEKMKESGWNTNNQLILLEEWRAKW